MFASECYNTGFWFLLEKKKQKPKKVKEKKKESLKRAKLHCVLSLWANSSCKKKQWVWSSSEENKMSGQETFRWGPENRPLLGGWGGVCFFVFFSGLFPNTCLLTFEFIFCHFLSLHHFFFLPPLINTVVCLSWLWEPTHDSEATTSQDVTQPPELLDTGWLRRLDGFFFFLSYERALQKDAAGLLPDSPWWRTTAVG